MKGIEGMKNRISREGDLTAEAAKISEEAQKRAVFPNSIIRFALVLLCALCVFA
jgi:hypothetical protein